MREAFLIVTVTTPVIDLTGSDWEDEHASEEEHTHVVTSQVLLGTSSTNELDRMHEEDKEEHMVVVSILLAWCEEEVVDRVMEESFETLRDD
jgi:hypothetical protein